MKSTFITYDTEILAAKADEDQIAATMELAKESTRFSHLKMPDDMARQFKLLRLSFDSGGALQSQGSPGADRRSPPRMEGIYGSGKYCPTAPG